MLKSVHNFLHHLLIDSPRRWHPLLSVYYLTYECNFRCPYCSDGSRRPYYALRSPTLSAALALRLLRVIRNSCDFVVITGGEPLRHPGFVEVMRGIGALGFTGVVLTTNGYEIGPVLSDIAPAINHLVFSLDTLQPDKADAWFGVGPGALRRIRDNIEKAANLPGRRFQIHLSSVVTPENIEDLYDVYSLAKAQGFRFAACPQLIGVKAHPALMDNPRYRQFYDFLIAEKRSGGRIQGTVDYLQHMRDLRKFRCRPFTMLVVSPAGDVFYPCLEIGHFAGNLLEDNNLHRIREKGREQYGPQPECDNRCHSACALGFALALARPRSLLRELRLCLGALHGQ
jgi:MoaA/NifB/PqqE/SkfB family radical SAM enzyme